jgi:hypothetical protein
MVTDCPLATRRKGLSGALAAAAIAAGVGLPVTSAWAASIFTPPGSFTLPQGIVPAPGGGYLISDAKKDAIFLVPAAGGSPTVTQSTNDFGAFGEVLLPAGYSNSGSYLAYGSSGSNTGIAALVGANGISPPTQVLNSPNGWYASAIVAPSSYGSIAAGSVVITQQQGHLIDVVNPNLSGTTAFATLGFAPFGVGFAPATFGAHAGQMFVSDGVTGNLYTVSSTGQETPFANLPLPQIGAQPGLRQFAWAPAGFGVYAGDLFVSVAAMNGGGGFDGDIDVLSATGQLVALYAFGTAGIPLDPRGLLFIGSSDLLISNAEPDVVQSSPSDFLPAAEVLPEPGTLGVFLVGLVGLGISWQRRVKK